MKHRNDHVIVRHNRTKKSFFAYLYVIVTLVKVEENSK